MSLPPKQKQRTPATSSSPLNHNSIITALIHGSIAWHRGIHSNEHHRWQWTCYIRGIRREKLDHFIKTVEFHLHPTFNPPVVIVDKHPFEVTRTGYGGFEIKIVINFHNMPSVSLIHKLNLIAPGKQTVKPGVPLISEHQVPIKFDHPTPEFIRAIERNPSSTTSQNKVLSQYQMSCEHERVRLVTYGEHLELLIAAEKTAIMKLLNRGYNPIPFPDPIPRPDIPFVLNRAIKGPLLVVDDPLTETESIIQTAFDHTSSLLDLFKTQSVEKNDHQDDVREKKSL